MENRLYTRYRSVMECEWKNKISTWNSTVWRLDENTALASLHTMSAFGCRDRWTERIQAIWMAYFALKVDKQWTRKINFAKNRHEIMLAGIKAGTWTLSGVWIRLRCVFTGYLQRANATHEVLWYVSARNINIRTSYS